MYDPAIARWTSIDPLAEAIPAFAPYAYVFNDPINHGDPTGMMGERFGYIATTVVNEDTGERLEIDDGYDFEFVVSGSDFETIKSNTNGKTLPFNKMGGWLTARWLNGATSASFSSFKDDNPLWGSILGWFGTDDVQDVLDSAGEGLVPLAGTLAVIPAAKLKKLEGIVSWIKKNIGKKFPGTKKGGGKFGNREGRLPQKGANGNPIEYTEYDVNPTPAGARREAKRIVAGSNGKTYYTDDHYKSFTEIKD